MEAAGGDGGHLKTGRPRPSGTRILDGDPTVRSLIAASAAALALAAASGGGRPVHAQELPAWVTGELRIRSEWDDRTARSEADAATLLRTRIGIRGAPTTSLRLLIQVQDSRAFGEETSTLADASADRLDLHQGWIELHGRAGETPVSLRAGRQEIKLGIERLVGAVGWTNTGRSFDSFRADAGPGGDGWSATVVAAQIDEGDRIGATGLDPRSNQDDNVDHGFLGAYGRLPRTRSVAADLFLFQDLDGASAVARDIDRTTLGGRVTGTVREGITYEAEGGIQHGDRLLLEGGTLPVRQEIRAWFATGRIGWTAPGRRLRLLRLGVDWLSGDDDPGDDEEGVFDTLFATNHKFYGFMDLFTDPAAQTGARGLVDGMVEASAGILPGLSAALAVHRFWTATERGAEPRAIGTELDLTVPYVAEEGVVVTGGFSLFVADDAATLAGLGSAGDVLSWAYLQMAVGF